MRACRGPVCGAVRGGGGRNYGRVASIRDGWRVLRAGSRIEPAVGSAMFSLSAPISDTPPNHNPPQSFTPTLSSRFCGLWGVCRGRGADPIASGSCSWSTFWCAWRVACGWREGGRAVVVRGVALALVWPAFA